MARLQRGDIVPHFEVQTVDGRVFSYSNIWQRRNFVLVTIPEHALADVTAERQGAT